MVVPGDGLQGVGEGVLRYIVHPNQPVHIQMTVPATMTTVKTQSGVPWKCCPRFSQTMRTNRQARYLFLRIPTTVFSERVDRTVPYKNKESEKKKRSKTLTASSSRRYSRGVGKYQGSTAKGSTPLLHKAACMATRTAAMFPWPPNSPTNLQDTIFVVLGQPGTGGYIDRTINTPSIQ